MPNKLDRLLELRAEGHTIQEIVDLMGISTWSVHQALMKAGVNERQYSFWTPASAQMQILLGTLLGDGHLALYGRQKNAVLSLGHCSEQKDWLVWKASQLNGLFKTPYPRQDTNGLWYLRSRSHPILTSLYKRLYVRPDVLCTPHILKKQITMGVLRDVGDLALAVWFCDDGSVKKTAAVGGRNDYLRLLLGGVSEDEYYLVKHWFWEKGLSPSLFISTRGNSAELAFNVTDSRRLAVIMKDSIPACMRSKLGRYGQ